MKIKKILIILISIFFNLKPMAVDEEALLEAVNANNVNFIREYLDNGGNPNYIINGDEANGPLLIYAMLEASEEMATLLVERGANVNVLLNLKKHHISPLLLALIDLEFSAAFVELLLRKGANLQVGSKDKGLITSGGTVNIFNVLCHRKITREKLELLIQYLFKLFGFEKIIEVALHQKNVKVEAIQVLVDNGAKIPQNIIEIAKKLNANKNILNFFEYQINVKKTLATHLSPPLTYDLISLVDQYCHGREEPNEDIREKELQVQLEKAVVHEDFDFIRKFLDNGGNINFILKNKESKSSLLGCALSLGKEILANLLIQRNAGLEEVVKVGRSVDGALTIAIINSAISLKLVKLILEKGAKIENVSILKSKETYNLIHLLTKRDITEEKRNFLFDYLLKLYGTENILEIALKNKVSGYTIKRFIKMGAKIRPDIVEIARKLNVDKKIIAYLEQLIPFNNQLVAAYGSDFPGEAITTIHDYYVEPEKPKKECLIM